MAATSDYVDSYYARTLGDSAHRPSLTEDLRTDICVIGGGMAGLATALGLAERGQDVTLLEGHRVGWGASGRNGGFVSAGFSRGLKDMIASVGEAHALNLYRLSEDAVALVRDRAERIGGPVGPIVDGRATLSWFDDPDEVQRTADWTNEKTGAGIEVWDREKVRGIWRSKRYCEGLWRLQGFTFHSLNFTRGVAAMAEAAGARLFEDSPVIRVDLSADPIVIEVDGGSRVTADQIVLCCSGYIDGLVSQLSAATLPIGTYVVLTEPVGDRLGDIIGLPNGVSDTRFASDYYRPLPDTRILWGGRISRWTDPPRLAARMLGGSAPGLSAAVRPEGRGGLARHHGVRRPQNAADRPPSARCLVQPELRWSRHGQHDPGR